MDSYGPSSVLLWGALIAADIGKANTIQALTEIHNHVCIQKNSEKKKDWWLCLISMIYDCPFQVETGDTIKPQIHCIQRQDGKYQRRDEETVRTG